MTNTHCRDCKYWDRDDINSTMKNEVVLYIAECLNPINPNIVPACYTKQNMWEGGGEYCPCFEPV